MPVVQFVGQVQQVVYSKDGNLVAFEDMGLERSFVLLSDNSQREMSDAVAVILVKSRKMIQESPQLKVKLLLQRLVIRVVGVTRHGHRMFEARYMARRQGANGVEFLRGNTSVEAEVAADAADWHSFVADPHQGQFQCINCTMHHGVSEAPLSQPRRVGIVLLEPETHRWPQAKTNKHYDGKYMQFKST